MQLPEDVREIVERRAQSVAFPALREAAEALSAAYRGGLGTGGIRLDPRAKAAAYLATRFPATYTAARSALRETRAALAGIGVASVLDLGAGSGAAALAARDTFPELQSMTLIEPDPALAEAGRELLPTARWLERRLRPADPLPVHDLVIAGYTLAELHSPEALEIAARAFAAASVALVVIEPGTMDGFRLVREIRGQLLAAGGRMAAPCPGEGPCPMRDGDWCHFASRVERTSLHRRLKGASLGYEDEKFSYVAVAKSAVRPAPARILRHPLQQPGLITLEVCRGSRTAAEPVSRRDKAAFRAARRAHWGDCWPPRVG